MMAERLAELRRDLCTEAYTSYLPKTVRELLDYIDGLKFANGVLDSAAKDAQAWSVRAQTAEAKCAQLEAQRGELARELDLTKREAWTAKERHKDERDRADGLRERLDELNAEDFARAQRGGAVVVPELTEEILSLACGCAIPPSEGPDAIKFGLRSSLRSGYRNGWGDLASRIQPIPADRVLAEGMVGVDRGVLQLARNTIHAFVPTEGCCCDGSVGLVCVECTTSRLLIDLDSALRAQQAKGE